MRFGDYEVLPSNQWCYQIYRVLPEGYDNSKARKRVASDGRALDAVECYPCTLVSALEWVTRFAENEAASDGDDEFVLSRLTELHDEIIAAASRLDAAHGQKEAAR